MSDYSSDQINQLILHKQFLTKSSKNQSIIEIAKNLFGLQATGTFEPYVYLYSRKDGFQKEELDNELYQNRSLIKIRGMRNTLFIIPKEDAPIIHNATNPLKDSRFEGFFTHTDFTRKEYNEIESKILEVLKEGAFITREIKKRINTDRNISIILSLMCDKLSIVRDKPPKGWKDRRNTYALMEENYPNLNFEKIDEINAINKLVLGYIKSYGPVSEEDIAWWGGFTKTNTRKAIKFNKTKIENIHLSERQYYIEKSDVEFIERNKSNTKDLINFLANLDPYLMGYKLRDRFIDSEVYDFVFDRSGNATKTILINGVVKGIWDIEQKPKSKIKFLVFEDIKESLLKEIKDTAKKIGKFLLEKEVEVKECDNPVPLTKRTAGTFMRPLKHC